MLRSITSIFNRLKQKKCILRPGVKSSQRAFLLGFTSIFIPLIVLVGVFGYTLSAKAQLGGVVSDPANLAQNILRNVRDAAKYVAEKTAKIAENAFETAKDVAFKNALKVYLGKIAEDTATWVASAGTGQKPLFLTDPKYFAKLNDAAAGDFLDTIAKDTFGVSLCDPGLAKTQIDIAIRVNLNPNFCQESCQKNFDTGMSESLIIIGNPADPFAQLDLPTARNTLATVLEWQRTGTLGPDALTFCDGNWSIDNCVATYQQAIGQEEERLKSELSVCKNLCSARRRTSTCSYKQLKENLHKLQSKEVFAELPKIFDPKNNELGQYLVLTQEAGEAARKAVEQEKLVRSDAFDIGPVTTAFGVGIKTPASITKQATQEGLSVENAGSPFSIQTGSPVADAIGIFTNTLSQKLLQRIFNKGLVDPTTQSTVFNQFGGSTGGVAAAKERYASLATLNVGSGGAVDVLARLASCSVDAAVITATTLGQVTAESCVIDESFRRAIEERLTVKQALDQGLLSDQKPFGFLANGQEPTYLNGYPYRSMIILRKNRIIPVGWELAAQFVRDVSKQNTTLRTIMEKFDDPTSPYYKLVDPNWVLKAPETMCVRTGFVEDTVSNEYVDEDGDEGGRKITNFSVRYCTNDSEANFGKECTCAETTPDAVACFSEKCDVKESAEKLNTCAFITPRVQQIQRREACIDEQTCIQENDDGSCKTYGTCVEEKSTWKFNGKSCDPQNATCQTYIDPSGTSATYLGNTLQTSICGPNNAGCTQYCTSFDYATQQWTCTSATNPANTIRLDRDAVPCDVTSEGCTAFIRQTTGTNLLVNSGFELSTPRATPAGSADFQGWTAGRNNQACGATSAVTTGANGSSQAAKVTYLPDAGTCTGEHYIFNEAILGTTVANKSYTASFTARGVGASCANVTVEYQTGGSRYGVNWEYAPASAAGITADWQRFTYTYAWPDSSITQRSQNVIVAFRLPDNGCELYLDDVQLEPGESATAYKEYAQANVIHLKRPPSEPGNNLGCTGNPATDPAACEKFARKCEAENVGCELYTPADGSAAVPGIAGQSCPADMVGCQSFREQPVTGIFPPHDARTGKYCKPANGAPNFEFLSCTDDADCGGVAGACQPLVSFVAQSGTQCTAADVGCEAYTNLDEVAAGGEGKAAFITPKLCVPPNATVNPGVADFFSWEGSNESGYQLKKFRFVQSNLNPNAPCTHLQVNTTAGTPFVCNDTAATVIDCQAEYGTNLDCTEFYDNAGNITYRLRSLVAEESVSCKPFRNATDNLVYYFDEGKSKSCSQAAAGCREYVGNTGSNIRTVLNSTFEGGSFAPWAGGVISTESIQFGGHSLAFSNWNANRARLQNASGQSLLVEGKTYTLSFWAKKQNSNDNVELRSYLMWGAGGNDVGAAFGGPFLTTDWKQYRVGPVTFSRNGNVFSADDLLLYNAQETNHPFFVDNVVLTEVTDSIYRIKGSQKACGGFEGCQAYTNRAGQTSTFQDFTKLCKTEKVGCEALINTQNSLRTPFAQTNTVSSLRGDVDGNGKIDQNDVQYLTNYIFTGGSPPPNPFFTGDVDGNGILTTTDLGVLGSFVFSGITLPVHDVPGDTVTTPADSVEYWVNDPQKACRPEDKACRALGRESVALQIGATTSDVTLALQGTQTQYLKTDPDAYDQILCSRQALSCEEFKTPEGSTAYFKNPANNVCDYDAASQTWKLRGSGKVCPTQKIANVPPAVPYGGFAGTCPSDQSGCTGYLDPVGTGEEVVVNGTFESFQASSGIPAAFLPAPAQRPQGWSIFGSAGWALEDYPETSAGTEGRAVQVTWSSENWMNQRVNLQPDTMYVVSADVKRGTGDTRQAMLALTDCEAAPGTDAYIYTPDNSMVHRNTAGDGGASIFFPADQLSEDTYTRISGRFYSGTARSCGVGIGAYGAPSTGGHWYDNVSIVETTTTTVLKQSVDATSCNGEVSAAEGCKLFNDRSNANLTYDVDQSPVGSNPTNPDGKGAPKSCDPANGSCDSNVLLKVKQDRVCKEWLAPTTTVESTKPSGEKQNLTLQLSTCSKIGPNGECQQFVNEKRCVNNPRQSCTKDGDCPPTGTGGVQKCEPFTQTANELRCSNRLKNACAVDADCRTCSNNPFLLCNQDSDCAFTGFSTGTCGLNEGAQCLGSAYKVQDFQKSTGATRVGAWWKVCSNNALRACTVNADCSGGTCGTALSAIKKVQGDYPTGASIEGGRESASVTDTILNSDFDDSTTIEGSGWELALVSKLEGGIARIVSQETKRSGNTTAPVKIDSYLEFQPKTIERTEACPAGVSPTGVAYAAGAQCTRCAQNPGVLCYRNDHCPGNVSGQDACIGTSWATFQTKPETLQDRLTKDGTYYVSFRARWVRDPDPAGNALEISIGNNGSAGGFNSWIDTVSITSEWKQYTVGPFELCQAKNGVPCKGNNITWNPTAHQVFDPDGATLNFIISGSTRVGDNPDVISQQRPLSAVNRVPLQIDDISLLPVLQVADDGEKSLIARGCRAYPDATAITCSYDDDTGKTHAGLKGYCIETDPKNPNTCLQWLPIDLPAGENNVLGVVQQAGYSQRNPLYLCTESKPPENVQVNCDEFDGDGTAGSNNEGLLSSGGSNNCNTGEDVIEKDYLIEDTAVRGMKLEELERVIFTVTAAEAEDWPRHSKFYMDADGGSHTANRSTETPSEPERVQPWTMFWCGGASGSDTTDCSKLKFSVNYQGATDTDFNYYTSSQQRCNEAIGDHTNFFFAQLRCTDGTGLPGPDHVGECGGTLNIVQSVWAGLCDASSGDGYVTLQANFIKRAICTNIVQVVESGGSNAAWASRVSTTSTFVTPGFGYRFFQDTKPFGSITAPALNEAVPELWDSSTEPGQQPIVVKNNLKTADVARAGSAFGCSSAGCASRICSTTGAACNTTQEILACQNEKGYCLGTGTVKVCQAGGKAGKVCDADAECGSTTQRVCANGLFAGQACIADVQCPINLFPAIYGTCGPQTTTQNKCDYGPTQTYGGGKYTSTIDTSLDPDRIPNADDRLDRLKLLFANAYREWRWESTIQKYVPTTNLLDDWKEDNGLPGARLGYNFMQLCDGVRNSGGGVASTPYSRANANPILAYCGIPPKITNITVNGIGGGTIDIVNGQSVQLKFNTIVDAEQLPLKYIAIDWDGDSNSDEIIPWGAAPRTDPAKPHVFGHAYQASSGATFRPRIQVLDNWDWTNMNTNSVSRLEGFPMNVQSDTKYGVYWQDSGITIRIR